MSLREKFNDVIGLRTPTPEAKREVARAKKATPWHVSVSAPSGFGTLLQEFEQSLAPGETIRFIGALKRGAFGVTDRRVVATSNFGNEKKSLPIDGTLSVYIDRDLTETNLRFTADGGREVKLNAAVLSPRQERDLREALPPGVML